MADEWERACKGWSQWPLPPLSEDFFASPQFAPRPRPERSFTTPFDPPLPEKASGPETFAAADPATADAPTYACSVPPGSSWSTPVAEAQVMAPPASPGLAETQARLLAHCLLVPGLAEDVFTTLRKAWLDSHALGYEAWDLLYVIEKQRSQYGSLILKQTDWPQRIQQAYLDKQNQDNPDHPQAFEGIVAIAWDLAFGTSALAGSHEEGQGCLREVMQQAARTKLLETLRRKDFNWEFYGNRINEYVSLLNELDAEGTETALRPDCETLTDFLRRPKDQPYLVEGILAAGQLAVVGGPEKGMKTNVTVDLALALAAGVKFLGHFPVPRPAKVLLVTGETCEKPLENLCRRILAARGLSDILDNLLIKQEVPSLASKVGLNRLTRLIKTHQAEVVILDPLYLMVWDSDPKGRPIDTNNITQIGKLVADVGKACVAAGATPVLVHHMSKTAVLARADKREPMQLSDLTGAGIGPVARQWLLLNYASPYDPDTGRCAVWLNAGGSAGHGGLHLISIHEGPFDRTKPLNGRTWQVEVQSGRKALEAVNPAALQAKETKKKADLEEKKRRVLEAVTARPRGALQNEIAELAGISPSALGPILQKLLLDLQVIRCQWPGDKVTWRRWKPRPVCLPTAKGEEHKLELLRQGQPVEEVFPELEGPTDNEPVPAIGATSPSEERSGPPPSV